MVSGEDEGCENTENEDSSEDETGFRAMRVKPINTSKPTPTLDNVSHLASTYHDMDNSPKDDAVTQFNSWEQKVKFQNGKSSERRTITQKNR